MCRVIENQGLDNLGLQSKCQNYKDSRTALASPRLTTYRVQLVGHRQYTASTQVGNTGTFYTRNNIQILAGIPKPNTTHSVPGHMIA